MKAIEHDTNVPITKIPDRLHDAATLLEASLRDSLGFITASADNSICHSIHIRGSIETKEQWTNGIWHNAKDYFNIFIGTFDQWLPPEPQLNELFNVLVHDCNGKFKGTRSRKDLTLDKAVQYVINQIKTKV